MVFTGGAQTSVSQRSTDVIHHVRREKHYPITHYCNFGAGRLPLFVADAINRVRTIRWFVGVYSVTSPSKKNYLRLVGAERGMAFPWGIFGGALYGGNR